jgi:hypothetical protein
MKNYTEVNIPRGVRRKVQLLAACQKTSEDRALEELIRHGLETYLAEQAARAGAAVSPLPAPLPDNESGV